MHSRGEWKSFAGRTGQTFKMKMIENTDFSMDIFTCYTYCQYMKKFNANVILEKTTKASSVANAGMKEICTPTCSHSSNLPR